MKSSGLGALCTQSGDYQIRTLPVRLGPFERQELRVDSSILERQGGPLAVGAFDLRRHLVAGCRIRCRKISDDGRAEWVPVSLLRASR